MIRKTIFVAATISFLGAIVTSNIARHEGSVTSSWIAPAKAEPRR